MAKALSQLSKSHAALLADAAPVAASPGAFVVKFKYDIHCQMVAENKDLVATLTQIIAADLGVLFEMLCIPEGAWTDVREAFIRDNSLGNKKDSSNSSEPVLEEEPYIADQQTLPSEDPLIMEAEKMFGKDFVEVIEE